MKTQISDCEVHFVTKAAYASVLRENPYIDKIHELNDSLSSLILELKNEKYDVIIDLHNNLRTRIVKTKLGVKSYSFKKLNWQKWLLTTFKINRLPNIHIVDRYMETVRDLNVNEDNLGLDYFIPEKDLMPLNWLPETHQNGFCSFGCRC